MITRVSILQAQERIKPFVKPTPLLELRAGLFLKMECAHEDVGAFKARGAANALALSKPGYETVATAALGSHGFAIGKLSYLMRKESVCFMPVNAPEEKKAKMKAMVDHVQFIGENFSEAERHAIATSQKNGWNFIHPYNDERVIAGQGTAGLEILGQLGGVANVYLPVGGGGLLAGTALALKETGSRAKVVGVQPEVMHAMRASLDNGAITRVEQARSVAEPLCVNLNPTAVTFPYVQMYADGIMLVSEAEIIAAMRLIYERTGQMVEGAGAIALAAAMKDPHRKEGKTVCVVSGANISENRFREITGTEVKV